MNLAMLLHQTLLINNQDKSETIDLDFIRILAGVEEVQQNNGGGISLLISIFTHYFFMIQ